MTISVTVPLKMGASIKYLSAVGSSHTDALQHLQNLVWWHYRIRLVIDYESRKYFLPGKRKRKHFIKYDDNGSGLVCAYIK